MHKLCGFGSIQNRLDRSKIVLKMQKYAPKYTRERGLKTPLSKTRLQFSSNNSSRTPNPNSALRDRENQAPPDHPVEVIGRVRDYPDRKDREKIVSILQINPDQNSVRVKTEIGYRDFTLDGVSLSENEDPDGFYKKFIQSRINGVKLGDKCTIMMYGPTGSGKSHTMFGCSKQPGIVYKSLKDILGGGDGSGEASSQPIGVGTFVQVSVLEIYNEEIYDLLSSCHGGGGYGIGWPKGGSASKVRLEVMGKKAKNATFISGTEAGKISKEIQNVEKRRIVKSTLLNDRSSRSHCMIILDVPTVGGRLMLVDMAGSENIEQAGQIGFEAKMQTAKINQGNIALKRVVESIANGDSHVPFRDSKLTMLLQDSFEDDKAKILMVLCASPDPKEIHKTISTLEYGAKAKCIVRGPHTPIKDKNFSEDSSSVILGSRIAAMDQFIYKLQMENKLREKERNEAHKELLKKEEEVAGLRSKLEAVDGKGVGVSEEEINLKVNERTRLLKIELENKMEECKRMSNEFVEMERKRMEAKIVHQQQEVEMLRRRLEETESELNRSRDRNVDEGAGFAKRLVGIYGNDESSMVKSMDLDMEDQEPAPFIRDVKHVETKFSSGPSIDDGVFVTKYGEKICLSTVYEEDEDAEEEVVKGVIDEKRVCSDDTDSSRLMRIHNIFTLCGNQRELSHTSTSTAPNEGSRLETNDTAAEKPMQILPIEDKLIEPVVSSKENIDPVKNLKGSMNSIDGSSVVKDEVYVKWEATSIENPGKFIATITVPKNATLSDLRKLVEIHLGPDNQDFTFLALEDPTGAPVPREKESKVQASKLPRCNNLLSGHLACLRPLSSKGIQKQHRKPLTSDSCFNQQSENVIRVPLM